MAFRVVNFGIGAYKAYAFLRKDFLVESSYRFAFCFSMLTSLVPVFTFFYVGRLMVASASPGLQAYGGDYFSFVLIGIAFTEYFLTALATYSSTIRRSQLAGCLEALFSTRTRGVAIVLYSALYAFTAKTVNILTIILVGGLLLGAQVKNANIPAALLTLALSIIAFSALGILSAAITLIIKTGDPIQWACGAAVSLLGGAVFPVCLLPRWLQAIAKCLPITYAMDAMREAVVLGHSASMLMGPLLTLAAMGGILHVAATGCFAAALRRARRTAGLAGY